MVVLTASVFFLKAFLEPWDYGVLLALWDKTYKWDFCPTSDQIYTGKVHTACCHEAEGIIPDLQNQQEFESVVGKAGSFTKVI